MTIQQQIEQLKKEFADKIAELEKQAKAEEQKQSKVWKPIKDDAFWCITSNGIAKDHWWDSFLDQERFIRGNFFKTEEEAEWADQHRIVETELKHFVAENDPNPITEEDWKDETIEKCLCFYSGADKHIDVTYVSYLRWANQVYASNEKVLKKAIEHIGEERLKKYYFGVE